MPLVLVCLYAWRQAGFSSGADAFSFPAASSSKGATGSADRWVGDHTTPPTYPQVLHSRSLRLLILTPSAWPWSCCCSGFGPDAFSPSATDAFKAADAGTYATTTTTLTTTS